MWDPSVLLPLWFKYGLICVLKSIYGNVITFVLFLMLPLLQCLQLYFHQYVGIQQNLMFLCWFLILWCISSTFWVSGFFQSLPCSDCSTDFESDNIRNCELYNVSTWSKTWNIACISAEMVEWSGEYFWTSGSLTDPDNSTLSFRPMWIFLILSTKKWKTPSAQY